MNLDKCNVMRCNRKEGLGNMRVGLNGEELEEVSSIRYLGVDIAADGN